MKNLTKLLGVTILALLLVACGDRRQGGNTRSMNSTSKATLEVGSDTTGPLKINFVAETRGLTYNHSSPLTMPNGTVIRAGDLKPFWQWIEKQLNIELNDVTTQSTSTQILQTESATGFKDANIYGGPSILNELIDYGVQGYFLDLNPYINDEYMPNFNHYLKENGNIRDSITAYNGSIYAVPYIAEIGYFARAFLARQSWVTALLDGKVVLENETATLPINYQGFWQGNNKRHNSNIIVLQNQAAVNGSLTFTTARNTLLDYIKNTYPNLEKPSDLFLGKDAEYDIDELVALWRLIRLAPNTLSKVTTGKVVPNANIVPFFSRQSNYRDEILRLATYFNGQRTFGTDTYFARFYIDEKGELQYSYAEDNMLNNVLPRLRAIYQEGLIAPDFANLKLKDNFRTLYYGGDTRPGYTQFGFMTFDFIPSTTTVSLGNGKTNEDVKGILPPVTKTPATGNNWVHYTENTRVVKNDGWAISRVTGGEKLRQALTLFDFFFSPEGSDANNFGTPDMIESSNPYISPSGEQYPRMNEWFNQTAEQFQQDGVLFSRNFLGFNFPIGYEKSIGFEQQFTSPTGEWTWKLYDEGNVLSNSYNATNPYFMLIPPAFSMTEQQLRQLKDTNIGTSTGQVDLLFNYITTGSPTPTEIKQAYVNGKIDDYIRIHREAFKAMQKS